MSLELIRSPLFNDPACVGYWRLQNLNDSKGSNHLTNNNSVSFSASQFNDGADFGTNNTNKSLNVLSNLGINGGNISISCWVKLLAEITAGNYALVDQVSAASAVGNRIRYHYNGGAPLLSFARTKKNVAEQNTIYTITLGTNKWYHIVYTYDGINIRGYVNGLLVAGPTAASGNGGAPAGNFLIIGAGDIGSASYIPADFASALIDDVAVFNRALSSAEISGLYTGTAFQGAMI